MGWYEEMEQAEQEYDAMQYELARSYQQGRQDAIDEMFLLVMDAYHEDNLDECTLHQIERKMKNSDENAWYSKAVQKIRADTAAELYAKRNTSMDIPSDKDSIVCIWKSCFDEMIGEQKK